MNNLTLVQPIAAGVYPSGWAVVGAGAKNRKVNINDGRVDDLYHEYHGAQYNKRTSIERLTTLIDLAKELFTNENVGANLTSSILDDGARRCLIDGITFALTGRRHVAALTYASLTDYTEQGEKLVSMFGTADVSLFKDSPLFDKSTNIDMHEVITAWVNQPNGESDMLCTMRILFTVNLTP